MKFDKHEDVEPTFNFYKRAVKNDFTIDYKKNCYQLDKIQPVTICKRNIITVEERMDQTIFFRLRDKYFNYKLLPEKPRRIYKSKAQWIIAASFELQATSWSSMGVKQLN